MVNLARACRSVGVAGVVLASFVVATGAQAQTNLVQNGSFTSFVAGYSGSQQMGGTGSSGNLSQNVSGWNSSGFAFIYTPNAGTVSGTSADTTGATNTVSSTSNVYLWGPGTGAAADGTGGTDHGAAGVANGLTNSPDGGNFIASDGASNISGAISQQVNGLAAGNSYKLTFYWAAAEQATFTAASSSQWQVSLGNQTISTSVASIPGMGFSGWMQSTMYFTATSASEALSFLAVGTPNGAPPFALLDGVSLVAGSAPVPEPATWAIMLVGLGGLGAVVRSRRKTANGGSTAV